MSALDYIIVGIVLVLLVLALRAGFVKTKGRCAGCPHAADCQKALDEEAGTAQPTDKTTKEE